MQMATDSFVKSIMFSDETTFHLSSKVNRQNMSIWGAANQHVIVKHVRNSHKINVFCTMSNRKIYGPFVFLERIINGNILLDMLQQQSMPQDDDNEFILQLDGAPPHFNNVVRTFLTENLPNRWIGRSSVNDLHLHYWSPRSPDLTYLDFFSLGLH